jgi:protein-L-isoaspartate(D-aspartate) O-methyltransferase
MRPGRTAARGDENGADWRAEAARLVGTLGPLPEPVAEAMRRVPRHLFVPPAYRSMAYRDEPLPLGPGETTISAPHMVAFQLEWAELAPGMRALEIGSGSGYLAALVAELVRPGGHVDALEIDPALARGSAERLRALGYAEVEVYVRNGWDGLPERAPFDRILVSAAAPELLPAWRAQLAPGGLLLAPVGDVFEQTMRRLRRAPEGDCVEDGPPCRFVSLVPRRDGDPRYI